MSTGSSYGVKLIPLVEDYSAQDQQHVIAKPANTVLQAKPPKSQLHEFYQQHKGTPQFRVTAGPPPPAEPTFRFWSSALSKLVINMHYASDMIAR